MRLTNARHSIHDAFAIGLTGPADNLGGSGKFNSNKWLANAGTAGLIIRAVMNQPAHLRAAAIFLNAPDNAITLNDLISLKSGLWGKFIVKAQVDPADQGVLIGCLDRILDGYRSRVWNHKSEAHTAGAMFSNYSKERSERLTAHANRLLDILHGFDNDSLAPVWVTIDAERDAEKDEAERTKSARARIAAAMKAGMSFFTAKKQVEDENA
jgi:hypothetical protein